MSLLYTGLAELYFEMYQKIFDYKKDFEFYNRYLSEFSCRSVLEIGCGTGTLGKYLIDAGYVYTGLDLYREMVDIAARENPSGRFFMGDMRDLQLDRTFDSALITGRTFAYLVDDRDVNNTLAGIYKILNDNGKLIFDCFDTDSIFGNFKEYSEHKFELNDKTVTRIDRLNRITETGSTWDWDATYIVEEGGKKREYIDKSTLRAFDQNELKQFLKLNDFRILEVINDKILVVIAEKQ
ncbi:class I SAM-dependent DNA methyltransferase [candidate division KSB1 bacterium]